jgi:hypothetical protein
MATYWGVPIPELDTKRLADYFGIQRDLESVVAFCKRICTLSDQRLRDSQLLDALTIAAVIRYGRCFDDSARDRIPDQVLDELEPQTRSLHEAFRALRSKHIAHSVNWFEENTVVAEVSDRPDQTEAHGIGVVMAYWASLDQEGATLLQRLAEYFLELIQIWIAAERERLLEEAREIPFKRLKARDMPGPFTIDWRKVGKQRKRRANRCRRTTLGAAAEPQDR